jgi:hypothetical protein
MDNEVVPPVLLPPVVGALFTRKLRDFLACLDWGIPGSGKMIGHLLMEKAIRDKSKKVGASHHSGI